MKRLLWLGLLSVGCGEQSELCGEGFARTDDGDCVELDPSGDSAVPEDTAPSDSGSEDTSLPPVEDVVDVYLLAGQSNMDGGGLVSGLAPSIQISQEDVLLFWSGWWQWRGLAPASYWGGAYFGPEVTFGRRLADADPTQKVALIKHAVSGTDLAQCWYPGESPDDGTAGDCYAGFKATVDAALAVLEAEGQKFRIAGMAWMQGESDATYEPWALSYQQNLTDLIYRVREDFSAPTMPFSMGKIDCAAHCAYRDIVRGAQQAVADESQSVTAVETADLPQVADLLHFDASGMRTLGQRLAESILGMGGDRATPQAAVTLGDSFLSNYTGDYIVGYVFELENAIRITDLGVLDFGLDGISEGTVVAIWDEVNGNLLLKTTVPSSKSVHTSLLDRWRYVGVEDLELQPGRYVIGSQAYNQSPDRYIHNAKVGLAEGVRWIEGRHAVGVTLQYPTYVTPAEASWFGPNFLFEEVPSQDELPPNNF